MNERRKPGEIRDAILEALSDQYQPVPVAEIQRAVVDRLGPTAASSVRSYLRLNTPVIFARMARAEYVLKDNLRLPLHDQAAAAPTNTFRYGKATLIHADCMDWLRAQPERSIQAVVTDPPYGLLEYAPQQQEKLRRGRGGVWRIPPSFDGAKRSPLPRFTVLTASDLGYLEEFFTTWARALLPKLVPGANLVLASNQLLSFKVSAALARAGLERRGEIVRLTMTMRGGDRPKAAHEEFGGVSVMPRSMWEPWLVFRKPIEGRVQDNLRKWKTGGFRRPSREKPFGDVIESSPTRPSERRVAPHPSLKPQAFLRELVRGVLPLGEGTILDPFAGSASTLAAAEAVGYQSIGVEKDEHYFKIGCDALPPLAAMRV
jgi:DNA modification methylase